MYTATQHSYKIISGGYAPFVKVEAKTLAELKAKILEKRRQGY